MYYNNNYNLKKLLMKCLINNIIIFSNILKLNFNKNYFQPLIKKTVISLINKKMIFRYKHSLKSPYIYLFNLNLIRSEPIIKNSKLFRAIINTPLSVFHVYSHQIHHIEFHLSVIKISPIFCIKI